MSPPSTTDTRKKRILGIKIVDNMMILKMFIRWFRVSVVLLLDSSPKLKLWTPTVPRFAEPRAAAQRQTAAIPTFFPNATIRHSFYYNKLFW